MKKRQRLEKTFAGEPTDRVPVALWRHWPGDDQRAADLAETTVDFQKRWDWDFVKVSPASSYQTNDYGTQDRWHGNVEGTREYVQRAVTEPHHWEQLPLLDPQQGWLGLHLNTLRLIRAGLGDDVPIIHTIFNPLAQAKNIAGQSCLMRHLHQHPDQVKAGLATITENILRYLDAMRAIGVDGIYYAIQLATYDDMTAAQYREFGREYDLRVLNELPDEWWLNMAHLHGQAPMFDEVADYPVQALNWHDRESEPNLAAGMRRFPGAVSGGLGRWDEMHNGSPESVHQQALDAIIQTGGRRFILTTGCVMMITTPLSHVRTVRQLVEGATGIS